MSRLATASSSSRAGTRRASGRRPDGSDGLRDRLAQAEAEWHDVAVSLERQRSIVRAWVRSVDETKAQLERTRQEPAVGADSQNVARLEGELESERAAFDREVERFERLMSVAERARTRLYREMGRLREEIEARES